MTVRVLLAIPALGMLEPVSFGQSVLHTFKGDCPGDQLGLSVSAAGDVDGDGFSDLIVGVPRDYFNGDAPGSAHVYSGADGSLLYKFTGDLAKDWFGYSVSGAGDVDADGLDDLIVGAPLGDSLAGNDYLGQARVYSGKTGSILHTLNGDSFSCLFGVAVSGAGDVNGDGHDDVIVGAVLGDKTPFDENSGSAWVISGKNWSALHVVYGDSPEDWFGYSVSGAGDVDCDGFADLIVGAWGSSNFGTESGMARVFSGMDGSTLYTFQGDLAGDLMGSSVSAAGDVDRDGHGDVIVGAPGDDSIVGSSGSAWVYSGLDGSVLYTFNGDDPGDVFGVAVSGAGDFNGDGFADLIVGARGDDNNGTDSGSTRVFSGVDGSILYTLDGGSPNDYFGASVSSAGDANADGFADVIVGAPLDDDNGNDSGRAWVIAGLGVIGTNYCGPANLNSTGQSAAIEAFGNRFVDLNSVRLTALQLPQQQFGYFLNSQRKGFVPFAGGSQGNLCLAGSIGRYNRPGEILNSEAGGTFSLVLDLTDTPQPTGSVSIMAGETWNFQAWFRDMNPGPTSNFTDGVSITFL